MKLSRPIKEWFCLYCWGCDKGREKELAAAVEQLESDSQMLEDLIEMMKQPGQCLLRGPHPKRPRLYAFYWGLEQKRYTPSEGSTPRECIQKAIEEWKKHE